MIPINLMSTMMQSRGRRWTTDDNDFPVAEDRDSKEQFLTQPDTSQASAGVDDTPTENFVSSASTSMWDRLTTTLASDFYPSDDSSSSQPGYFTTTKTTTLGSNQNGTSVINCTQYDNDLFWIKVGLFSAAGVCLMMLCCMSCITALVYWAYYKIKNYDSSLDVNNTATSKRQNPIDDKGFRRLTITKDEDGAQKRQLRQIGNPAAAAGAAGANTNIEPLRGSPSPADISSFSAHMAPPVPKSAPPGNSMGVSPAEETPIRKGALDRLEQEEAKRHTDMMLMNDKSLAKRVHQAVNRESSRSRKSKQSRAKSRPSTKNPSFVVDKNTLKLVRIDGKSSKDVTGQSGAKGGAVNIPFKF